MPNLVDEYMAFKYPVKSCHNMNDEETNHHVFTITTIDTHERVNGVEVHQCKDEFPNSSLIRAGYLGCTPIDPPLAISLNTLELFYRLKCQHPRLSIQAMVRALADLHNVSFSISASGSYFDFAIDYLL